MEHLVRMLNDVDESALEDRDDDKILSDQDHLLVSVIRHLATILLITERGDPDFIEIDRLFHEHGYFIFPGERDRFGWLSACLRTKKGIIVFG
jgi:hypothetical protein